MPSSHSCLRASLDGFAHMKGRWMYISCVCVLHDSWRRYLQGTHRFATEGRKEREGRG